MSTLADEADWPREVIDRDYNARASVTLEAFETSMQLYRSQSETARRLCLTHGDVVYDAASGQTLDIFGTTSELRPVFVFIHGGYWRALSKHDSAFMAATLAAQGVATAVVDYRLAPSASLNEIVREVRAAVSFLWHDGARYGIDPERIFVGGSSAGGHLTGTVVTAGWHTPFGVPENVVKGAMPISGLFHLAPIAKSFVQDWIKLGAADVEALSPAVHVRAGGCPLIIAYADGEPAGFARQSREFHRLWRSVGSHAALIDVADRTHFDVVMDLADVRSDLLTGLMSMIGAISA